MLSVRISKHRRREVPALPQVETVVAGPLKLHGVTIPLCHLSQQAIHVTVLFFGRLKELTGHAEDTA